MELYKIKKGNSMGILEAFDIIQFSTFHCGLLSFNPSAQLFPNTLRFALYFVLACHWKRIIINNKYLFIREIIWIISQLFKNF